MEISNLDINLGDTQYNKAYIGDKELYQKIVPVTNCPPTPCECVVEYNDSKILGNNSDTGITSSLTIDASKLKNVENGDHLFYYWKGNIINLDKLDTSNFKSLQYCFAFCSNLVALNLSRWDTRKVTDLYSFFYNCSNLTFLDVKKLNVENVTTFNTCFRECVNLTSLDLSGWDTRKVTNISYAFNGMKKLTELYLDGLDLSKVTSKTSVFTNTTNLQKIYMRDCNQATIDLINELKPANAEIITE